MKLTLSLLLVSAVILPAQTMESLAPVPPMGWNSWDAYGTTVTEAEVKANAAYMAAKLKQHGWQYVVVDIQWAEQHPKSHGYRPDADLAMDKYGRLIPAPNRFPSAAGDTGFTDLAADVHRLGLKFGIHIMRGIPRKAVDGNLPVLDSNVSAAAIADKNATCRWNSDMYGVDMTKPHAQAYYDSIVKLYASWGVDYIKADDMAIPFHGAEIAALHKAIVKSGRPIVLSLSPGPADLTKASFYAANANLWRISDDFWDNWDSLKKNFVLLANWAPYTGKGAWPDADMLPLGRIGIRAERGDDRHTRFTADEQQTLMTLWCIARSPLMFGGDLPSNDEKTLALITNDEVLKADQKATGSKPLFSNGNKVAWMSKAEGGNGTYVALFNIGDQGTSDVQVSWAQLGVSNQARARDLWQHRDLTPAEAKSGLVVNLKPHASALYLVR